MTTLKYENAHVLMVDDDAVITEIIHRELVDEIPNLQFTARHSSNEAIDFLIEQAKAGRHLDVIILDMMVPRDEPSTSAGPSPNDLEAGLLMLLGVHQFQLVAPHTPIIVFTGKEKFDDCVRVMKAGAFYYLPKTEGHDNNSAKLVEMCVNLIRGNYSQSGLKQWSDKNLDALLTAYPGKVIGLIQPDQARAAGVDGDEVNGYVLIVEDSVENIGMKMLLNPVLRWQKPQIIQLSSR